MDIVEEIVTKTLSSKQQIKQFAFCLKRPRKLKKNFHLSRVFFSEESEWQVF